MESMEQAITNAVEEIKRVDHLIYVSLKYTRTVDVIRSTINRIIESYNAVIEGFMEELERTGKITENPQAPMLKVNLIKENFNDEKLHSYLDFYVFLRQLYRADFERSGEFRKNVTMTSEVNGETVEVKIDTVLGYYDKTKEFLHYIKDNYRDAN